MARFRPLIINGGGERQRLQSGDSLDGVEHLSPLNKGMMALVTTIDGNQACSPSILAPPPPSGWISVYVNGVSYLVGNGTKVSVPCYFSGDSGVSARSTGNILAGDFLFWNGSVAGFQLDGSDRIDFVFESI